MDYGLKMLATSDAAALIYLSSPDQVANFSDFKEIQNHPIADDDKGHGMDSRMLGVGAQIIRSLGIIKMRTHVTQHRNLKGLAGFGLEVTEHVIIPTH